MDTRELIAEADRLSKSAGLTQAEWSRAAGYDANGMAVSRTFNRGNCKLSTFVNLLKPLGYRLKIEKEDNR